MATGWVYVLGEVEGRDVKIGYTSKSVVSPRLREVVDGWNGQRDYVVLAAVRATPKDEKAMAAQFLRRTDLGSRTEYFWPEPDLLSYVNWLRSQWFVSADGTDASGDTEAVDPSLWLPSPDRVRPQPPDDPTKLFQDYETRTDNLVGTAWSWMVNPVPSIQDYFTPPEIVKAASVAMGGIDLDAASHRKANEKHQIPDYFDINRSAFDNRWYGRVWLNPPYGDNAKWYREIERYVGSGDVEQLCMLSPVHAFTTQIARPVMRLSTAFVMLNPTPEFWGNSKGRTGTNLPHGILYIGKRTTEFFRALEPYGYPMSFQWEVLDEMRRVA